MGWWQNILLKTCVAKYTLTLPNKICLNLCNVTTAEETTATQSLDSSAFLFVLLTLGS